ncbi:MAG: SWIM zinc finger family protein [Rhodocyclaceae bacterium]
MPLTTEDILKLAPDESSAKAAKGLVIPAKWPLLGQDEQALWGECQGSGSKPYQVQIDKAGPAFKCSCPSRKFPCKHGLALMLLSVQHAAAVSAHTPPAWVAEWLQSRHDRADRQEQKKVAQVAAPTDLAAQAKREAARLQRMGDGLDELERWLADRVRHGLAQLSSQPDIWGQLAARMVDAQLPGMALRVRRLQGLVGHGEQWPQTTLAGMGQLQLLVDAFRRRDTLSPAQQADLRAALGWVAEKEDVLLGEPLADDWLVLGIRHEEENRLWLRRAWLRGHRSGRLAMLLDYAHGTRHFELNLLTGSCLRARLAFYPGAAPLRAWVVDGAERLAQAAVPAAPPLDESLGQLADSLAANPWQWPQALTLGQGVVHPHEQGWLWQGPSGAIALSLGDDEAWQLVAESGGHPLTLFGEWSGHTLRPLAAWREHLVWQAETEAA